MKKALIFAVAVLAVVCLVSCMSVSSFNKLYVGMTRSEVLSLYGRPNSTGYDGETETDFYVYYVPSSVWAEDEVDYKISFKNDRVVSWGQIGHTQAPTT
ncbi:MAG: outer membrane protein assembly factor BamE, partial [Sphaerochaetaceae bacterium]|nr:outer membrane protein assembly factor BamE [Sphaerochaetaceae bacterium]